NNNVQIGNGTLTFAAPNGSLLIANIHPRGLIMNDTSVSGTPGGTQGVLNVQAGLFDTGSRMILASAAGTRSTINVTTNGNLVNRGNIRIGNSGTAQININ